MAFKFFRKRKKIVFGLMVLLMLAFLASPALHGLGPNRAKGVYGYAGSTELTHGDIVVSAGEVDILVRRLGLTMYASPQMLECMILEAFVRGCEKHDLGLAWTLLRHEADEMGIRVTDAQVEQFLTRIKLTGDAYKRRVASFRDAKIAEKQFRGAIAGLIQVYEAFQMGRSGALKPLAEIKEIYRDLTEHLELAVVTFPADKFVEGVGEPDDDTIDDMFARFDEVFPGADPMAKLNKHAFGYRVPHRADIAYLLIDSNAVALAVEPPEARMKRYWREHGSELRREIKELAPLASKPTATGSAPASAPAPVFITRKVKFASYAEAKPEIRKILGPDAAAAKTAELVEAARKLLTPLAKDADAYPKIAKAMLVSAKALLAKPIGDLPDEATTVADIVKRLEEGSGVRIVYPFGEHGDHTLSGEIKVTPKSEWRKLSLGEALKKMASAAKFPEIEWVTCAGFDGTIFPSKPIPLTPVVAGRTKLTSLFDLSNHDVLQLAFEGADRKGGSVLGIVVTTKEFNPAGQIDVLISPGEDYRQAMYVSGRSRGRLLWRLVAAQKSHTPEEITPEIREQIIKDYKVRESYKLALAAAEKMLADLAVEDEPTDDPATPAKKEDKKPEEKKAGDGDDKKVGDGDDKKAGDGDDKKVGDGDDKKAGDGDDKKVGDGDDKKDGDEDKPEPTRLERLAKALDLKVSSAMARRKAAEARGGGYVIRQLGLPGVAWGDDVIEKAFSLVPEDPDDPCEDQPAVIVEIRREAKVVLLQRTGYRPSTQLGLEMMWVPVIAQGRYTFRHLSDHILRSQQIGYDVDRWFRWEKPPGQAGDPYGVKVRTDFSPKLD